MDPEQLYNEMLALADEILAAPTTNQDVLAKLVDLTGKLEDMAEWSQRGGYTDPEWCTTVERMLTEIQAKVAADKLRVCKGKA